MFCHIGIPPFIYLSLILINRTSLWSLGNEQKVKYAEKARRCLFLKTSLQSTQHNFSRL